MSEDKPKPMEKTFYGALTDKELSGLEQFDVERFIPSRGNILVVLPPKIAAIGNIQIPDGLQERPNIGRVASVPHDEYEDDDDGCPYAPGDVVVYVPNSGRPVTLSGRNDLMLFQYCNGPESEILGKIDMSGEYD